MNWRAWLDASPAAQLGLALMRDATGRERPLEPLVPARPAAIGRGQVVAFWSLAAGVGTSTVAALVAHRSAAAGQPPALIDLDRWAPSLALMAQHAGATVSDALVRPGHESALLSRWSDVPFLPGAAELHRVADGARLAELVERVSRDRAAVLDLGAGRDALDPEVLAGLDRLCVVVGGRVAQLQAAFCAAALLPDLAVRAGMVTVGASEDDARRIAARLPWPLWGAIPADPYLADDTFAARAPTVRAIDALIRSLE
jgi:Mrp family chromosome partitioning ATPase